MIKEGVLEGAGLIFGGHLDRHYRPGTVVVSEGAVNASSDNFLVEIIGQGAHGARPHESIDAVVVGSLMIMALQTIVSREIDPARPSVVSVGQFHAGTAPNVIAGQAKLEGTVRAQDSAVRRQLLNSVRRIAESIAQLHGAKIHITVAEGTPPLVNDSEMATLARFAATEAVGEGNVLSLKTANMGVKILVITRKRFQVRMFDSAAKFQAGKAIRHTSASLTSMKRRCPSKPRITVLLPKLQVGN